MNDKSVLLAPNEAIGFDSSYLKYPVLASYKMDGIRVLCNAGQLYSRNMKAMKPLLHHRWKKLIDVSMEYKLVFDGEAFRPGMEFGDLASIITARDELVPQSVKLYVFDYMSTAQWDIGMSPVFMHRVQGYQEAIAKHGLECDVVPVEQREIFDANGLARMFSESLDLGLEGLMVRNKYGKYKHGRATLRENIIYKFKEWVSIDGYISDFVQATVMTAEKKAGAREVNELGYKKQVHTKDDRELADRIGSFVITPAEGLPFGAGIAKKAEFNVQALRNISWADRTKVLGRMVECRAMVHGAKDRPRFAGIVRFRPDLE